MLRHSGHVLHNEHYHSFRYFGRYHLRHHDTPTATEDANASPVQQQQFVKPESICQQSAKHRCRAKFAFLARVGRSHRMDAPLIATNLRPERQRTWITDEAGFQQHRHLGHQRHEVASEHNMQRYTQHASVGYVRVYISSLFVPLKLYRIRQDQDS
jgi:hypothetical protein